MKSDFDWQGHRGARGLLPENSIPAFLKALEFPVNTLELDVVISQDSQVVVSHEPWLSHHICSLPEGGAVTQEQELRLLLYQMPYREIRRYDCGIRGNERFKEQQAMPAVKPLLSDVVLAVEEHCRKNNRVRPQYNIEIKSDPDWDNTKTPVPAVFARLVLAEVKRLAIGERTCIQSFDVRSLQEVHRQQPEITTALLIDNALGVEANLTELGFVPDIYSPYYRTLAANVVDTVHGRGMRIIPWTVNEVEEMRTLIGMGVDGIITDYPDKILKIEP